MHNVLLVTATRVEAQAVLDLSPTLTRVKWKRQVIKDKTTGSKKVYYALGAVDDINLYMVQSEMGTSGPGASLSTVYKAIAALSPVVAIIMVGIAFGARPAEQKLGDILVARQLKFYEPQKVKGQHKVISRGDRVTVSTALLDKFSSGAYDWQGAKVHFGLILSGEKLINDHKFCRELLTYEPEAIGGEMEGSGLYTAAQDAKVDWILVKAICDWADGKKKDDYQQEAARNAVKFVLHVIQLAYLDSKIKSPRMKNAETIKVSSQ